MSGIRTAHRDLQAGPRGTIHRGMIAVAAMALATLFSWRQRSRQRRHLQELDDRLLRDIGLSPHDVRRETAKPAWRA